MLSRLFPDPLALGLAQALITMLLALAVAWLGTRWGVHLGRETLVALVRGLLQVVLVGLIVGSILQGPPWVSIPVLAGMIVAAAATAARRAEKIPGAFRNSLVGVGLGSGIVILLMIPAGVIDLQVSSAVPVGSMIIANAMNSAAVALERFRSEIEANTGRIEAGLSLGADPRVVVSPYVQRGVQAGLIPRIDTLRSLGIVWIPGVMAGMILSGTDPVYAAVYQFAVLAMIFAAAGLASIFTLLIVRGRAFSEAGQLVLRPGLPSSRG